VKLQAKHKEEFLQKALDHAKTSKMDRWRAGRDAVKKGKRRLGEGWGEGQGNSSALGLERGGEREREERRLGWWGSGDGDKAQKQKRQKQEAAVQHDESCLYAHESPPSSNAARQIFRPLRSAVGCTGPRCNQLSSEHRLIGGLIKFALQHRTYNSSICIYNPCAAMPYIHLGAGTSTGVSGAQGLPRKHSSLLRPRHADGHKLNGHKLNGHKFHGRRLAAAPGKRLGAAGAAAGAAGQASNTDWIAAVPPDLGALLEASIHTHEPLASQPGSTLHQYLHSKAFAELKGRLKRRFNLLRRYLRACSGAMHSRQPLRHQEQQWAEFFAAKSGGEQCRAV
jgi:hypothetical protein